MMTRRRLVHAAALSAGVAGTSKTGWSASGSPLVETGYGKVRGRIENGISVFKGLRYGASTAGKNRFLPPRPTTPWTGIVEASEYAASAVQTRFELSGSEDCLFLNLWTPSAFDDGAKRPVMVWLHGGGFSSGSGSSPGYDGVNICNKEDVVLVTLNHRLNVFSATHLANLIGEEFAESGCVGMLDIVAALQWIHGNISQFGGDPDRVMIFGESGGGRKVSTLLAMPVAKGLFHRAVVESGAVLRVTTEEEGERLCEQLLAELEIDTNAAIKLQTTPVENLLGAYQAVLRNYQPEVPVVGMTASTPVINPLSLPAHPFDPTASENSADVPVIAGYNRTEETFFYRVGELLYPQAGNRTMDFDLTDAQLLERMNNRLGVDSGELVAAYKNDYPDATPWDLQMLIATDHPRGVYPKELAKRKAALGKAKAYVYRFDWELNDEVKSPHALEIPFVFANTKSSAWTSNHPGNPHVLADTMSAAWAAFARTGVPNTAGLPTWTAYDEKSRSTMIFNDTCRIDEDPNRRSRLAMEKVLGLT